MDPSQLSRNHGIIDSFLRMLRETKGPQGVVDLCVIHYRPQSSNCRGFTAGGSYRPDAGDSGFPGTPGTLPPANGRIDWNETPFVKVGERVEFHGKMPCDGYVHLFNLGTSGECAKLFPSQEHRDNFETAGAVFWVPSQKYCDIAAERFAEFGPTTADTGKWERLLAIVTRDNIDLEIEDLHPKMAGYDVFSRRSTRGPGFTGGPRVDRAKLFDPRVILPKDWEYGLLEMEVRQ